VRFGLYFFKCDYDTHERFAEVMALALALIEAFISHCYGISNSNARLAMSKLYA
jgi:hypothetical protein